MVRVVVLVEPVAGHPVVSAIRDHFAPGRAASRRVYRALLMDLLAAAAGSGGDVQVAAPTDPAHITLEDLVADALGPETEVPITRHDNPAPTIDEIVGEQEGGSAVIFPRSPLLRRTHLDAAAMRLRRHDVVLGPSAHHGLLYAAFASEAVVPDGHLRGLVDATDTFVAADRSVDFIDPWPALTSTAGVEGACALLTAYERSGRDVAQFTRAALADLDAPA